MQKIREKGSEKILDLIKSDISITIVQLAEKTGQTTRAVEKQLIEAITSIKL